MRIPKSPTIEPVTKARQWAEYHGLCRRLYATDGAWIEPLHQSVQARWQPKNPWLQANKGAFWLARIDGEVVGSISAQVDHRLTAQPEGGVGYFGQFECIDNTEVAQALVEQAINWLRQQGVDWVKGPFDLHINESCGLLVKGFETPPMLMMPHHRPYYQTLLESVGFEPEMRLLAYRIEPNFAAPKAMQRLQRRHGEALTTRPLDTSRYSQEIELLRELFNDAWQFNWGFVPFSREEFRAVGRELRPILKAPYTSIAMLHNEPVGFLIALPNINELIRDFQGKLLPSNWIKLLWRLKRDTVTTARVPLMGVKSRFHGSPMGALIAFSMIDAVRWPLHDHGIREVEMSWILETNAGMNGLIEAMGGDCYKEYQMYRQALGPTR
ncbi:MAG TPA: N-acetyltransferase [Wenzhouxiangella sp.]